MCGSEVCLPTGNLLKNKQKNCWNEEMIWSHRKRQIIDPTYAYLACVPYLSGTTADSLRLVVQCVVCGVLCKELDS